MSIGLIVAVSTATLVLYVLYSRILAAGRVTPLAIVGRQSCESKADALRHQLNLWPDSLIPAFIFVLGILLGGLLIYRSYRWYQQGPSAENWQYSIDASPLVDAFRFFVRGIAQRWIWPGLIVAYTFGIVASLVLAALTPAFMPFVEFGSTNDADAGEQTTGEAPPTAWRMLEDRLRTTGSCPTPTRNGTSSTAR